MRGRIRARHCQQSSTLRSRTLQSRGNAVQLRYRLSSGAPMPCSQLQQLHVLMHVGIRQLCTSFWLHLKAAYDLDANNSARCRRGWGCGGGGHNGTTPAGPAGGGCT
jgi:hypothetical protein